MNEGRDLEDFQMAPPSTWAALPVDGAAPGWALPVGRQLCETDEGAVDLAGRLEENLAWLLGDEPPVLLAVWVPDPLVPIIVGILRVNLMKVGKDEAPTREYYRSLTDPAPKRKGVRVLKREMEDIDLPAGPALFAHEVISRKEGFLAGETVWENVIWSIFPPGSRQALQLNFSTDALDWGELMAADARIAVESLRIVLADGP